MRNFWKFLAVAVAMVTVAVPVQAQEPSLSPEQWMYRPNGEKCVMASVHKNEYQERELALPGYLQRILAKCEQYNGAITQKSRASKERRRGMLLSFFE